MRQSVVVVFACAEEIFYIIRQNHLKDFPGYASFPGGKVDKGESMEAALEREIQEETGVDLKQLQSQGLVDTITPIGRAQTPDFNPVIFENFFFKIELNKKITFDLDMGEVAQGVWATADKFLQSYHAGKLLVVPPVITLMKKLKAGTLRENTDLGLDYNPQTEVPMIESIYGVKQFFPRSDTLPPADRTNCFLIGDESKGTFLIDPSPRDKLEYKKLISSIRKHYPHTIHGIFLTHHHPDHHKHAPDFARLFELPIYLSEDSHQRIEALCGEDYFLNIKIVHKKDGDVLTTWLGKDVELHAVPGHDEGQLALIPKTLEWALVGDLIQTVGTVVVAPPEGDMAKYFSSLNKMIALEPKNIIPSHGIAQGGVNKLKETLSHRQMREKQIKELLAKRKSKEEILTSIYAHLDPKLHQLALKTIEAHIKKIKAEM